MVFVVAKLNMALHLRELKGRHYVRVTLTCQKPQQSMVVVPINQHKQSLVIFFFWPKPVRCGLDQIDPNLDLLSIAAQVVPCR
jgi:hypothetical protein